MNFVDRSVIYRFHQERISMFGEGTTSALGWKEARSQQVRFEILSQIGDMNKLSVLDVGCGHGDLRAFLGEKYPALRYAGIDQMEEFLDIATSRYGHLPDTTFYLGDCWVAELPNMDYVLACGLLAYRNSQPDFIQRMIAKLFSSCRLGLGFNLLKNVDDPEGILVNYDPQEILQYCRTLSPKVVLREGYAEDDFTIFVYQ
jgi:trans-aconitate methyltransferase